MSVVQPEPMLSVPEYAKGARMAESTVRLLAAQGKILAQQVGNRWVVNEWPRRAAGPRVGRPISSRSFDDVADLMDGAADQMSPDRRRRARERRARIEKLGLPEIGRLARRADLRIVSLRAPAEVVNRLLESVQDQLTGVSSPWSEVYGPIVDAYASEEFAASLVRGGDARAVARDDANIVLRVSKEASKVRRLHVIADLLEDSHARSRSEAKRLFEEMTA